MQLPRLYAIADADLLRQRGIDLVVFAAELADAGVNLLQYRNKSGSPRMILEDAARLKSLQSGRNFKLMLNDRADLALLSGFDGVHVGQEDLPVEDARRIVGPNPWVGVSTHTLEQLAEADRTDCDYIAYGPIFSTTTKDNPDPIVGLAGLRQARKQTNKPLVAIGGIMLENCRSVIDAGADSVAIISALLADKNGSTRRIAERFLAELA